MSWKKVNDRHEFHVDGKVVITIQRTHNIKDGSTYVTNLNGRENKFNENESIDEIKDYLLHRFHKFY